MVVFGFGSVNAIIHVQELENVVKLLEMLEVLPGKRIYLETLQYIEFLPVVNQQNLSLYSGIGLVRLMLDLKHYITSTNIYLHHRFRFYQQRFSHQ